MADDGFDNVQFPVAISYGAVGGPQFSTTVVIGTSGFEQRNENWSESRAEYDVQHGLKTQDDVNALVIFFRARRGKLRTFRFKDHLDFKHDMDSSPATFIQFATGDGTAGPFQINKTYTDAGGSQIRTLTKIVAASPAPVIFKNGVAETLGVDYTIDVNTGLVTFLTPFPIMGDTLEWSGEFDVHARFDTDTMQVEIEFFETHNWPVEIVEVRG
jgi:uncharacterized protein (TIGR02217 family)